MPSILLLPAEDLSSRKKRNKSKIIFNVLLGVKLVRANVLKNYNSLSLVVLGVVGGGYTAIWQKKGSEPRFTTNAVCIINRFCGSLHIEDATIRLKRN